MISEKIFNIKSPQNFTEAALEVFNFQHKHVAVYQKFCDMLKINPNKITQISEIPFLPIQFFKSHKIIAEGYNSEVVFTSSGTTGSTTSKHYVAKTDLYETSFNKAFINQYGTPKNLTILALLPSYLEREGSSLIYMVDSLIQQSDNEHSGFYLHDMDALIEKLTYLENKGQKTILLGVSYALLDLIEKKKFQLKNTVVMETGGMKGRRKEMVKQELHSVLKEGFGVSKIHSEYGMTELLSQAYSIGDGVFKCPPWMKVLTRDTEDPFTYIQSKTGGINVIDLANLYSCSFIATQDLGKVHTTEHFEVVGRFDNSDIRGCNLMIL